MALELDAARVKAVLLDIEGTTTPVEFVYDVLFPYARNRVADFIRKLQHDASVRADLDELSKEHRNDIAQSLDPPPWSRESIQSELDSVVAYIHWLMDRDRKTTALKSLQGRIWEAGYRSGELRGEVFADVPPAFARWKARKIDICVFSSGSTLAQRLLFSNTTAGDLTPLIRSYFDTTVGAKNLESSYARIAAGLSLEPNTILFLSDVVAELDAARAAGLETALCLRPGKQIPMSTEHPHFRSFDEVLP